MGGKFKNLHLNYEIKRRLSFLLLLCTSQCYISLSGTGVSDLRWRTGWSSGARGLAWWCSSL